MKAAFIFGEPMGEVSALRATERNRKLSLLLFLVIASVKGSNVTNIDNK